MWYSGHGEALFHDASAMPYPPGDDDDDNDSSDSFGLHNECNDRDDDCNDSPFQDEELYSSSSDDDYGDGF